jgi:hypothetical protein
VSTDPRPCLTDQAARFLDTLEDVIRRMVVRTDGEAAFEAVVSHGRNGHAAVDASPVVIEG